MRVGFSPVSSPVGWRTVWLLTGGQIWTGSLPGSRWWSWCCCWGGRGTWRRGPSRTATPAPCRRGRRGHSEQPGGTCRETVSLGLPLPLSPCISITLRSQIFPGPVWAGWAGGTRGPQSVKFSSSEHLSAGLSWTRKTETWHERDQRVQLCLYFKFFLVEDFSDLETFRAKGLLSSKILNNTQHKLYLSLYLL